jgi:hypothetical protein
MGKNVNNDSNYFWLKCYIGIICALVDILFHIFLEDHLRLLVLTFLALCGDDLAFK